MDVDSPSAIFFTGQGTNCVAAIGEDTDRRLTDGEIGANGRESHFGRAYRRHEAPRGATLFVQRHQHLAAPRAIRYHTTDDERYVCPPLVVRGKDIEVVPFAPRRIIPRARRREVEM